MVTWSRQRPEVRDEELDILERRLLMFLEPQTEPAGGEAAVAMRLFPRDQCCQLERLGDCHAADFPRGHLGEDEVVVFQRPAERSFEGGPARSTFLLPGPRRHNQSKERAARPRACPAWLASRDGVGAPLTFVCGVRQSASAWTSAEAAEVRPLLDSQTALAQPRCSVEECGTKRTVAREKRYALEV